ncbi:MAG: pro-sigmaK processing inhibitor BofA family protein, partial [Bacillus sp. (in: firmicutes)]
MEPFVVVAVIVALIIMLLLTGTPSKPLKFIGSLFTKIVIGGMLLFFLNAFGSSFGL